jgi:putative nucleotidyltransferase with HDIG domain
VTRLGRTYIAAVGVAGAAALAYSVYAVGQTGVLTDWHVLLLAVLTWVSGSFAVRIPKVPATIYVSEAFFFTLVLMYGGPSAAICMAIDGLLISVRRRHNEPFRIIFNIAEPAVSVLAASAAFYLSYGKPPIATLGVQPPAIIELLLPVVAMAGVYFLFNSVLNAVAVAIETRQNPYRVWRDFVFFALNNFGGASAALLIAGNSFVVLAVVAPLVVISWFTFKASMARVEDANQHLLELNRLYLSTVETLAMAIDAKDQITHGHIRRVQVYARGLAESLDIEDTATLQAIDAAAVLHDMGKIGVPERILNKPGKLTPSEYDVIKGHTTIGAKILSNVDFPYPVVPIVRSHHENWDGTGYPDGLDAENIPIGARILAVVDCFDALTSHRPYRPALSDEEALAIVTARRGTMYDPRIVDLFLLLQPQLSIEANTPGRDASAFDELLHSPPAPPEVVESTGTASEEVTAQLLSLSDLANELAGHTTVEDLAVALGWRVRQTVPCDLLVFYLRDRLTDDLIAAHASGADAEALRGVRLGVGEGVSGWVALNRTTIRNSNGALDLGDRRALLAQPLDSVLATPLCARDVVVGVLSLYGIDREAFTADHQHMVEFAARQIGPALEQALSFEQERAASLFDAATGLPNERYLERVLASAAYAGRGDGPKPGLLLLGCLGVRGRDRAEAAPPVPGEDVEDFLLRLAATARTAVRVTDLVFRTGDHEVAILMSDCTAEAMANVARRVTEAMGAASCDGRPVGISAAFALYPDHAAEPVGLPRAARARQEQLAITGS